MSGTSSNRIAERKGERGSVNNAKRLAGFGQGNQQPKGSADWGSADARWIAVCVVAASSRGIEISFGLAKDHGALSLKLYDFSSGERVQLWFNQGADLDAELEKVYNQLDVV